MGKSFWKKYGALVLGFVADPCLQIDGSHVHGAGREGYHA
jgi:hypothetical protein